MTTEPYLDRRRRLMRSIEDGLILVRGGGPEGVNPNFYYLTGIAEPSAAGDHGPHDACSGPQPPRNPRCGCHVPESSASIQRAGAATASVAGALDAVFVELAVEGVAPDAEAPGGPRQ